MKVLRGTRVAVAAIAISVTAGAWRRRLRWFPATMSMGSAAITDVTPVQWRGRERCRGGCRAGDRADHWRPACRTAQYDEPFPDYLDDYPPRYGGPSDMAVLTGRLIAFHAIGHSIRSAERIGVATASDTIASSRRS